MVEIHTTASSAPEEGIAPTLDEIAREGARRMLIAALEAEVAEYIERYAEERDEDGYRLVVRNGLARARQVTMGCGTVEIAAPRVHDRRTESRFTSQILPPSMRKSPAVAEVLPLLYLRGLSTGDFQEALPVLLGEERSAGLSPSVISRMTAEWEEEFRSFQRRDLSDRDYVYVWVDGIYFNVRLEEDRVCMLVMIGVRPCGTKELIALEDGYRESKESWAPLLRSCARRGMQAPALAIGDGALGFWAALREVWPQTQEQRDWVHRLRNVLDKLPKRLQSRAKDHLKQIMEAANRADAEHEMKAFEREYGAKYPKAVETLLRDGEQLLTFFAFPAEHWKHIRTTNVIESPFATVRLRQRVTRGAGSRAKAAALACKLLRMAEQRWRRLDGSHLLPLVRAGVTFIDGVQQERQDQTLRREAA
jgi:putative transposase